MVAGRLDNVEAEYTMKSLLKPAANGAEKIEKPLGQGA